MRKKNAVIDILTWVECFNSYTAVLTTYFPSRSRDLLAYMALIIRTAKRFRGKAWLDYDRAFRREAAATNLRDWSQARIQTVAKVARATVRFFPPRIFRGSPLLDTALRIFKKYILVI